MISERTVAAKARGVRLGNPTNLPDAQAAGHKTMVKDADDHAAKVLSTIREIVRRGVHSVHKIAAQMNERGVPTRRGGSWSGTSILNTIRRCGFQTVREMAASA